MKSTKKITYQSKLGKAIKVAVPMLAMLGGSAAASTRHVSASVNGVQLNKFVAAVYVAGDKEAHPAEIEHGVFGAFSHSANVRPAGIQVDQQALSFLKENNLLTGNGIQQAQVSGDIQAGRKVFSIGNSRPVVTVPSAPRVIENGGAVENCG